jgi:hypothetical protein
MCKTFLSQLMAEKLENWSNQLLIQMEINSIIYREKWGTLNRKEIFLVKTSVKIIGENCCLCKVFPWFFDFSVFSSNQWFANQVWRIRACFEFLKNLFKNNVIMKNLPYILLDFFEELFHWIPMKESKLKIIKVHAN